MRILGLRRPLQPEVVRKAIHLMAGAAPLSYEYGVRQGLLVALTGAALVVTLGVEWGRRRQPIVRKWFGNAFGRMLREREWRGLTGATWLVMSTFGAIVLLPMKPAVATLWCSSVADPVGTIFGRALGGCPSGMPRKTAIGSISFFAAALSGVWLVAELTPARALAVAVAATFAERFPGRLDDNLSVSLIAALVASAVT
jgi:dolichol kinase